MQSRKVWGIILSKIYPALFSDMKHRWLWQSNAWTQAKGSNPTYV